YAVEFADAEIGLSLEFDAVEAPRMFSFGGMGHLDQVGRVTGELTLQGEPIPVDCLAVRDRSWSIREDKGPIRGHYDVVIASPGPLMVTNSASSHETIEGGYLVRDGVSTRIVSGRRTVERDGTRPIAVRLTTTDEQGREALAEGAAVNGLTTLVTPRMLT